MPRILEAVLMVVIPVAWGLSINYFFDLLRRGRRGSGEDPEADAS